MEQTFSKGSFKDVKPIYGIKWMENGGPIMHKDNIIERFQAKTI